MNPLQCEFLAENEYIQIKPNFNAEPLTFICGEVNAFEAGIPVTVPIWLAIHLKKRHRCSIICPEWLSIDELKKFIVAEGEKTSFSTIPKYFFEIAHILLNNAKEDIEQVDQIRTLVKDLWDKREAKMRTSSIKFLSQYESAHAQLDNLTQLEIAYFRPVIAEATRTIEFLNKNMHSTMRR